MIGATQRTRRIHRGHRGLPCVLCVLSVSSVLIFAALPLSYGQTKKRTPARATQTRQPTEKQQAEERAQAKEELKRTREEFIRLTKEYRKSLEELLALYEKDVTRTGDRLKQVRDLYAQGLLARRDVEEAEQAVATARAKSDATRQQIANADTQVAETLVEAQVMEQIAKAPPPPPGKVVTTPSYIRYSGAGLWSLAGAWKVQGFFLQKFGRQLPVSAYGQTQTHDRLGYDHRNSMDVPVRPASAEGQALMAFLRANAIPFTAFSIAIPGAATGPHIHVGMPSHRITPR